MTTAEEQVRAADVRWQRRRRRLIGYGQWDPWRDAEPVRAYVRQLMDSGLPMHVIAARTGVGTGTFDALLYGSKSHALSKQVRTENAEAIMAFRPTLDDYPDDAVVSTTGSRRRLQALATVGFPAVRMAVLSGTNPCNFHRIMGTVFQGTSAATARLVRAAYDEWWDRSPAEAGVADWVANRTRRSAATQGWVGPLAWDDETIDDPDAVPVVDAEAPPAAVEANAVDRFLAGESLILDAAGRRKVIAHYMEWTGRTPAEIAAELDMTPDGVSRSWERTKRAARDAGTAVPWRRTYIPLRERGLTYTEMETAA